METSIPNYPFSFKNVFLGDSADGGKTWRHFRPLRDARGRVLIDYGQCHGQLIQVPDGRVVLVYDNRYPPEERDVRARTSWDGGQTWDPAVYYLSFGLGSPASVVLEDGTFVTVTGNWVNNQSGPIGPPTVQAVRWKLPPDSEADGIPDQWDTGYMVSGNRFYPLPIGSTLIAKEGTFCRQPGPGFTGEYRFVFIVRDQAGKMNRKMVTVNIVPKFPGLREMRGKRQGGKPPCCSFYYFVSQG